MKVIEPHRRIKEARERAGLSIDEVAVRSGINKNSIYDFEMVEGDLCAGYSPKEVQRICRVIGIRPVDVFADNVSGSAVSQEELIRRIREECGSRGITIEQFEDVVGWSFGACMEKTEVLLEEISIDGLQWLCRELNIDWRRVILSLDN